jgi:CubicO group peptidase (beta-lactamase class C family)
MLGFRVVHEVVERFVSAVRDRDLGLYGVHVYRRGVEPVERRLRSDDRVNLYSVSKTFVSAALGIAEAEGRLGLGDRAIDYFPAFRDAAAPGADQVTIRHLITMTSGSSHVWFAHQPITVPDLAADFFAAPLEHEPGTHFRYTGSGPYVAARVLHAATGANVRDYLLPRVFGPLGIHNPQWHTCPLGYPFAESDLLLTTSELARFGRLLLDEGTWQSKRLVPAEYCRRIAREKVPTTHDLPMFAAGYGLGAWCGMGERTFRMDGHYGQFCIVSPEREAVVTVTAHTERDPELLDLIRDELLDSL